MTQIRQNTQALNSNTYTDTNAPGAAMEPAISTSNLQVDLNNIRSIINDIINGQTGNWFDGVAGRDVNTLDTDLTDLEDKTILCRISTLANVTVGAATDVVVLTAPGETPTEVAAIGVVTTEGAVCAELPGAVGTASATVVVPGQNAITPKNLCVIIDTATGDVVTDGSGEQVFGLLQIENGATDGAAFDNAGNAAQLSFVVVNATRTGFDLTTAASGLTIEYAYIARFTLDTIPEECFAPWPGGFVDQAAAVDVTRQNAYDNQGTTPVDVLTSSFLDLEAAGIVWEIRDDNQATLLGVTEGSGAGTSSVRLGADVDTFDNDAAVNDFAAGVSVGTSLATSIDVNVTAGLIESTGAVTLESNSADATILSTTGGNVVLDSAAAVDIDATTSVFIDAATSIEITRTGGSTGIFTGEIILTGATGVDGSSNHVTLTAGSSTGTNNGANIILTPGDTGGAPGVVGVVDIVTPAGETEASLRLSPSGTNGEVVSFYSGSSDPNGTVTATRGSLFLRDNGATGQAWINTDNGTTWSQLQAGAATTTLSEAITNEGSGNFQATNSISWGNPDGQSVDFTGPGGAADTILEINALAAGDTVVVNGAFTATGAATSPAGQSHTLTGGAGAAATDGGGGVSLIGGIGNTTGAGGGITATGGASGATGNGGPITVTGGAHASAGAGVFDGGDVSVTGGTSDASANGSAGGDVSVAGGEYLGTGGGISRGGNVAIAGGNADTGGGLADGGAVTVDGGVGNDIGGPVTITAGRGVTTSGGDAALIGGRGATDGGDVNITGGLTDGGSATDDGGTVNITSGTGTVAPFNTGAINITVPTVAAGSNIAGGSITISAGNTGTRNVPGADVEVNAGDSNGGGGNRAGNVEVNAGSQTGGAGGVGGSIICTLGDSTNSTPGVFTVTGPSNETEELVSLETTGTGGDEAQLFVGGVDPSAGAGVAAPVGSFFYRDVTNSGTTGEWYGKTGAANTAWEQFVTGTAGTTSLSAAITAEGAANFTATNSISWGSADGDSVDFTGPGGAADTILEINALAGGDTVVVNGGLTVTGDAGSPGQSHTITGGAGAAATNSGGGVAIAGGAGNTTGSGGLVSVTGGAGGVTGNGAIASLTGGAGGSTSGNGGGVSVAGGSVTDGNGGSATVAGANGVGTNRDGGSGSLIAGDATGSGSAGAIAVTAGDGGVTGVAGTVAVTSGNGGSTSGPSGAITISTGTTTDGDTGSITLDAANSAGAGTNGGDIILDAGDSIEQEGGLVIVRPGDSTTLDAGYLWLDTPNDDDEHIVQLTTGGTNGTTTHIHTGTANPDGAVLAPGGSLYLRRVVAATGSNLFINVSAVAGEGTDWDEVFTASSRTFVQGVASGAIGTSTDISNLAPASNVTMDFGTFPTFPSTQAEFNTRTKIYINGLLSRNGVDAVRSGTQTTAFQLAVTSLVTGDVIAVEQWPA